VDDYRRYVLPYSRAVIERIRPGVPVIHFATGNPALVPLMSEAGGDVIGVDWRLRLDDAGRMIRPNQGLQGNLDPVVLCAPVEEIRRRVREMLAQATHSGTLPNKDLDTGDVVYPGTYPLEDYAYADLLHRMTRDPSSPIPFGIKRDLQAYFADPAKAKYIQSNPKKLAQLRRDLPILKTIPTRALEPAGAFLPESAEDKPGAATPSPQP